MNQGKQTASSTTTAASGPQTLTTFLPVILQSAFEIIVNILCILQSEELNLKRLAKRHFIRGGNCWCSCLNLPRDFRRGKKQ